MHQIVGARSSTEISLLHVHVSLVVFKDQPFTRFHVFAESCLQIEVQSLEKHVWQQYRKHRMQVLKTPFQKEFLYQHNWNIGDNGSKNTDKCSFSNHYLGNSSANGFRGTNSILLVSGWKVALLQAKNACRSSGSTQLL